MLPILLLLLLTVPAIANSLKEAPFLPMVGDSGPACPSSTQGVNDDEFAFSIFGDAVQVFLTNPHSDGRQLGDLRVGAEDIQYASGDHAGDVNATMLTTSLDLPEPGDEVRLVTLAFRFGDGADQIVVQGATSFLGAEPTIDRNQSTIRPITGGSGRFSGAGGWSETIHLGDGTWKNTFHLLMPERDHEDEEEDDPDAMSIGDELKIKLPSNPSTGFSWAIVSPTDDTVLTLVSTEYIGSGSGLIGAPGTEVFRFQTTGVGSVTILLHYTRPWETNSPPADTYTQCVTVDEEDDDEDDD